MSASVDDIPEPDGTFQMNEMGDFRMPQYSSPAFSRRNVLQGAALTFGAAGFLQSALAPGRAKAQDDVPSGTVHSFSKEGVTFHTYVSPPEAVHVTSHVVELGDELLLVDATMLPATAREVSELIASTGKPVDMAILSHEHPDHWGGADAIEGVSFATLPQIREAVAAEAEGGSAPAPNHVLNGPNIAIGKADFHGIPVEFRHYEDTEAPHIIATIFPEQKVAIVQDLVYNGVFFAPGVNRKNWIQTLERLRDDPAFDTLLVGHGLPTSRGDLDTAIAYIRLLDDAMTYAATPDAAIAQLKTAYPAYSGDFLLSLIPEYWGN